MNRILAIFKKDITQIFRNRLIAVITFLAIFLYALVYNLMPSKVDEVFKLGFYFKVDAKVAEQLRMTGGREEIEKRLTEAGEEEEGLEIAWADSLKELKEMVEDNDVSAGISFDISGKEPSVELYVSSKTPEEVAEAGEMIAREIGYALVGHRLPADFEAEIIGPDMVGSQIPERDRMRVLFLSMVFLLELYALGNLLVEEERKGTVQAVLATPVNLTEFMAAKATTGIVLAFSEGVLSALLLRAVSMETLLPLAIFLFLGAAMMVGVAFIVGAISRDFMSMALISMVPLLVLMIPGFLLIAPGAVSPLIKAIPTYYLIEPLHGILNYHLPLADYYSSILYLSLFTVFFFVLGWMILRRRLA